MPSTFQHDSPNILVLLVDQMRYDAMGCSGNPIIQTPCLDRMAEEGTYYRHAVTPAPVCVAARHSLLTGLRCAAHGRWGNNQPEPEPLNPYLPQLLGGAGYLTEGIGKMHFLPPRRHFGFHRMQLMEEIPRHREEDEYLMYLKEQGYGHIREVHGVRNLLYHLPQVSAIPEEHHGSTWVADRTIDFLRSQTNQDRPFFLASSWIAPHPPWNPPESFASMYRDEDMALPVNYDRDRNTLPNQLRWRKYQECMGNATPERLQRIRALYYASISLIDKGVGRILSTLDDLGLSENTLVLFASDHGEMLGDQGWWQKQSPYEGSVRIPMLMRMPGTISQDRVSDELVTLLDVMPTALEAAGVEYPGSAPLAGASLLGSSVDSRSEVVIELWNEGRRWLSLRRRGWKYNYFLLDGWEELYDLGSDPQELDNLLLDEPAPNHRRMADEMNTVLTAWEQARGFPTSLDAADNLCNHGQEVPFHPKVNRQFPLWVNNLPAEEHALMESPGQSVVNALRHETTVRLEDISPEDLQAWKESGGSLAGTSREHLLDEPPQQAKSAS